MRNPPPLGTTDADIGYLSVAVRENLLDSMLTPELRVHGSDSHATLQVMGNDIVKLNRPDRGIFEEQLKMVRAYADLREDRTGEILVQTEDLLSFYGALGYLSASRHKNTLALIYLAQRMAVHVEMPFKHYCRSARPIDFSSHVQPMIQTPDHSSFPSGHATEVFACSTVLARVMTGLGPKDALAAPSDDDNGRMAGMAFRLAHRIASNRSVAGVHFPVDSASGAVVGCGLGEAMYRLATGASDWPGLTDVTFTASNIDAPSFDLTLSWLKGELPADAATAAADDSTILGKLWKDAAAEWEQSA